MLQLQYQESYGVMGGTEQGWCCVAKSFRYLQCTPYFICETVVDLLRNATAAVLLCIARSSEISLHLHFSLFSFYLCNLHNDAVSVSYHKPSKG